MDSWASPCTSFCEILNRERAPHALPEGAGIPPPATGAAFAKNWQASDLQIEHGAIAHFAAVVRSFATVVNNEFSEPPIVLTTVRIATPMPAAIRPYSIAVTPD